MATTNRVSIYSPFFFRVFFDRFMVSLFPWTPFLLQTGHFRPKPSYVSDDNQQGPRTSPHSCPCRLCGPKSPVAIRTYRSTPKHDPRSLFSSRRGRSIAYFGLHANGIPDLEFCFLFGSQKIPRLSSCTILVGKKKG